jgi:hypothetical protein
MRRRAKVIIISLMLVLLAGVWSSPARAGVSFDFFYSNLSPHGSWQVSGQYGRVWRPYDYTRGWNPYYDGHWVYADVGWTWVSDYPWGAIPYHYGTWVFDPEFGWVWVPGYVWAPAWVVFRTGPDYIGWAPVSPGFTVGVSTSFGVRAAGPFVFVSARNFLAPRVRTCVVPESTTRVIINHTKIVNTLAIERNVVVNRGPDVRFVEKASGHRVRQVSIERVPGIGPGRRISRDQIAVDTRRAERGVRVAEPVAASRPLPDRGARRTREDSRHAERAAEPRGERAEPPHAGSRPGTESAMEPDRRTRWMPRAETPSAGRPSRPDVRKSQSVAPRRTQAQEPPAGIKQSPRKKKADSPPRPDKEHGHP